MRGTRYHSSLQENKHVHSLMASQKKEEVHAGSHDRSSLRGFHEHQIDGGKYNSLSRSLDLAKLNPNCQMNYLIYL